VICDDCERVTELDAGDAYRVIREAAKAAHFNPRATVIEVSGVCAECRKEGGAPC